MHWVLPSSLSVKTLAVPPVSGCGFSACWERIAARCSRMLALHQVAADLAKIESDTANLQACQCVGVIPPLKVDF